MYEINLSRAFWARKLPRWSSEVTKKRFAQILYLSLGHSRAYITRREEKPMKNCRKLFVQHKICLLCVDRGLKYRNYLGLSPTMFFLCTFYDRSSVSGHPPHHQEGKLPDLECTQHLKHNSAHSTPRHI